MEIYRCRKCRWNLEVQNALIKEIEGCTDLNACQSSVMYLDVDLCPPWIVESLKQASWIKGKLLCLKCKGRLGSFDFVNQKYCRCRQHTIPVIHLLKDRIDEVQKRDQVSPVSQRAHYSCAKVLKTTVPNPFSDTKDTICRTQGKFQNVNSETASTKGDTRTDNQKIKTHSEDISFNNLLINDRQVLENCCGQVDSFNDLEEHVLENSYDICDWSEMGVSAYNKFEVLGGEETIQDCRAEGITMEPEETKEEEPDIPADLTCAVCLEMFYRPHRCEPCGHTFCEHCLRQLCRQTPTFTPCPLCRNVIRKCVFQYDLTENINSQFEEHSKNRRHETRKKRRDNYPLPSCAPNQYERRQNHRTPWALRNEQNFIITSCFQEILVRFAWLLLLFFLHNIIFHVDNWFKWEMYAEYTVNFNYFLLTLTFKLVLFGPIYCVKKYFYIDIESQFMGQAVLFVFILSFLYESSSWVQSALNMIVLGSLFL